MVESQNIPREVIELCRTLADKGYRAWVVGGCLRDLLLGRVASDWDLATDARPEQVSRVFPKVLPTGVAHGTVTVRHRGKSFELTTLRGEGAYSDGRRPDAVTFVSDIEEDLARRDFTVNALAFDPLAGTLIDPFDGCADLERRLIRAVGDPRQRFSEDGLRVLRAARFCATLEFSLEADTEAAIGDTLTTFRKVSAERVRDEWLKALRAAEPSRAFVIMARTGLLGAIFPTLAALPAAALSGSLAALDDPATERDPVLRLAALLWPLHAQLAEISDWLTRYRFANQERDRVLRLVRYAQPDEGAPISDPELRRRARAIERPHLRDVGNLGSVLAHARHGAGSPLTATADALRDRLSALASADIALSQKELAVSGKDLMGALGLQPGPQLGQLLHALLDLVLDDPTLNERQRLVALAQGML